MKLSAQKFACVLKVAALLCGGPCHAADIREIRTPRLVIQTGHSRLVTSIAFCPDGKTLASGSQDSTIKLWDVVSGQQLRTLSGRASSVQTVAFSPDGKTLASGSQDGAIKLWDIASGQELRTLNGDAGEAETVASPLRARRWHPGARVTSSCGTWRAVRSCSG